MTIYLEILVLTEIIIGNDINTVILSGVEACVGCLCACLPTLLPLWKLVKGGNPKVVTIEPSHQRSEKRRQDSETHIIQERGDEQHGAAQDTTSVGRKGPIDHNGGYQIWTTRSTTVESDRGNGDASSFDDDIDLSYPLNTHKASVTSAV